MLRNWSSTRPGTSMPAEYSVTSATDSSRNTISASGPSKTVKYGLAISQNVRLSFSAMTVLRR